MTSTCGTAVLSDDDIKRLKSSTYLSHDESRINLSEYDIHRLRTNDWCSDNVLNLALTLRLQSLPTDKREKVVFFDSQIYQMLLEKGAAAVWSVKRSRALNLFTQEFVLFTIFTESHYSMVAVVRPYLLVPGAANPHGNSPCFLCMDSLGCHDMRTICGNLRGFLEKEWGRLYPNVPCPEIDGESLPTVNAQVPKQRNARDCAIYTYIFGTFAFTFCQLFHHSNLYSLPPSLGSLIMFRFPPSPAAAIASKFSSFVPAMYVSDSDMPLQRRLLLERFQVLHLRWKGGGGTRSNNGSGNGSSSGSRIGSSTNAVIDLTASDGDDVSEVSSSVTTY